MSFSDSDSQADTETLEHLLGVVVENREKRCLEVRENALQQARAIIKLAYSKGRVRMHHHIDALREKYRLRVTAAIARNQTLLRRQHQQEDRATLDVAWPLLREAMLALWDDPVSRHRWLDAALTSASKGLREHDWRIEHPPGLSAEEINRINLAFSHAVGKEPELSACDDIEAGIRIIARGTVIDATLEGLLQQKTAIEARLIAHIRQGAASHE
jgi:F0F1-type ATP synthase delta subunit